MASNQKTEIRAAHWDWVELPEDDGDPRLLDACWALMDVRAKPPAATEHGYVLEIPVLDLDPDLSDLPIDHTQGTIDDPITQVAVVRLAKAVLAVADNHARKPAPQADPNAWYLTACVDCAKALKVRGQPPDRPLCLHCDIVRAAPEHVRAAIRATLRPLPE